jgi:lipopolysaccharide/colanic/teichoic acid biosynthesis glycosyltransferase
MLLKKWEELPELMQNDAVKPYYNILKRRPFSLIAKRLFDIVASAVLLLILWPLMLFNSILCSLRFRGPAIFRQERVTLWSQI